MEENLGQDNEGFKSCFNGSYYQIIQRTPCHLKASYSCKENPKYRIQQD